jgi:hypothetical protein
MKKVEILLNENKILNEGKYSLKKIYAALDEEFIEYAEMEKSVGEDGTIIYTAVKMKNEHHYAEIMISIKSFVKEKWFVENVIKYVYGNSKNSDNPKDYILEDILFEWGVGKSEYIT